MIHREWLERLEYEYTKLYLTKICKNLCTDYYRREKCVDIVELNEELFYQNDPGDNLYNRIIERECIWNYINEIKGVEKEALILKYCVGLTNKEIAIRLNIPVNTVAKRLSRGREKIKQMMTE